MRPVLLNHLYVHTYKNTHRLGYVAIWLCKRKKNKTEIPAHALTINTCRCTHSPHKAK